MSDVQSQEYHDAHLALLRATIVEKAAHREPILGLLKAYTDDVRKAERDLQKMATKSVDSLGVIARKWRIRPGYQYMRPNGSGQWIHDAIEGPSDGDGRWIEVVPAEQLQGAVEDREHLIRRLHAIDHRAAADPKTCRMCAEVRAHLSSRGQ